VYSVQQLGVCKILSGSVDIWQYEGQKNMFLSKTAHETGHIVWKILNRLAASLCRLPAMLLSCHSNYNYNNKVMGVNLVNLIMGQRVTGT